MVGHGNWPSSWLNLTLVRVKHESLGSHFNERASDDGGRGNRPVNPEVILDLGYTLLFSYKLVQCWRNLFLESLVHAILDLAHNLGLEKELEIISDLSDQVTA